MYVVSEIGRKSHILLMKYVISDICCCLILVSVEFNGDHKTYTEMR